MTPEMTRPYPRDRIGNGTVVEVESTGTERAALAMRMGLPDIHALHCKFDLQRPQGGRIVAKGRLRAQVTQNCVLSREPFEVEIDEAFEVCFVPAGTESEALDLDGVDEVTYEGDTLDLGEAAAEQLALALDPFPRKPGASVSPEGHDNGPKGPFAALQRLRERG